VVIGYRLNRSTGNEHPYNYESEAHPLPADHPPGVIILNNIDLQAEGMPPVQDVHHLNELFNLPVFVLFKHSLTCPISGAIYSEVLDFLADQPNVPAYVIPVQTQRKAAALVEQRTGVRHESPQLLVIRDSKVVASASHFAITGQFMAEHLS
jgi:bacillithiol system protein YtxJ